MNKKVKIGIDLGGTRIKLAIVDARGKPAFRKEIGTPKEPLRKGIFDSICSSVEDILEASCLKKTDIVGLGIGVPGPVDSKKGIVHYFPNIKGWDNVPMASILQQRLGIKVALDNDVNAMTLGEFRFGAGRGASNIICLTLGTGVGGGIIINGELYRGSSMCAGEIGHMPINEKGPKCNCGGIACLERYIGNRYILDRSKRIFGENITLEKLSGMASMGNKKALSVWQDVAEKLSIVLVGVVNLLNPDIVIVGGGVSKAGELILSPLIKEVKCRAMRDQARHVKIVKARLGNDAGIIGASLLV